MNFLVAIKLDGNGLEEMGELFSGGLGEGIDVKVAETKVRVGIEFGSIVFSIFEEAPFDADSEGRDLAGVEVKWVFVERTVGVLPGLVFGGIGDEDAEGFVVLPLSNSQ